MGVWGGGVGVGCGEGISRKVIKSCPNPVNVPGVVCTPTACTQCYLMKSGNGLDVPSCILRMQYEFKGLTDMEDVTFPPSTVHSM